MPPEPDWYTSADPDWLIRQVPASGARWRQLRLFAAACVRQVWDRLTREARHAVEVSERFADGRATEQDLRAVAVRRVHGPITVAQFAIAAAGCASGFGLTRQESAALSELAYNPLEAARLAARVMANDAAYAVRDPAPGQDAWNAAFLTARAVQADIARDIFPPPGVTPAVRPEWLTSAVLGLARTMDETGDFSAAPILADALQDAGCADPEILNRLRHPGPHVRGCWPVDRVLGRG